MTGLETEGDARKHVLENPEEAVVCEEEAGPVYFVADDGEPQIVIEWPDGTVDTVAGFGDSHPLPSAAEIVSADQVPDYPQ